MKKGGGAFNKAASVAYNALDEAEKAKLSAYTDFSSTKMTVREVKKAGGKIFGKIRKQVLPYLAIF